MAKIIFKGWLKPENNSSDIMLGNARAEYNKTLATQDLENKLKTKRESMEKRD